MDGQAGTGAGAGEAKKGPKGKAGKGAPKKAGGKDKAAGDKKGGKDATKKAGADKDKSAAAARPRSAAAALALKNAKPGDKGKEVKEDRDMAALQRALLATAFSAECRVSDFTIQRRALAGVLRRAQVGPQPGPDLDPRPRPDPRPELIQVSGAEAHELSTDTELTGHVRMGFEEVAEVAHKLRARPGAKPGLLGLGVSFGVGGGGGGGGGGGLLGAADAAALTPETYQALARGFATHDDARGSVAYGRLTPTPNPYP